MAATIKIDVVTQLDPDQSLFALCMERAAAFHTNDWTEYASRVETLVEIAENIGCQRVTVEVEHAND